MLPFLKKLLGVGPNVNMGELIANGAIIVDVRTPAEYKAGHLKESLNIPLDSLPSQLSRLKKDKAIITCCASGRRSSAARNLLKSHGFEQVYNGGSWMNLHNYL